MARARRDINTLSETELRNYTHAIAILRTRSLSDRFDPTGYAFQAMLHNGSGDPAHPVGPCVHKNDVFLPWHRSHLFYFEKLLQEADPPRTADVTIPYWDWLHVEPGKFPAAFQRPDELPELHEPDRNLTAVALPPDTQMIVTGESDINAFGGYPAAHAGADVGRLEAGPHDYMHPFFIGGKMAKPATAAKDAIYFSFHCFIDLLWAEWQQRNGNPPLTSPDADLRGFLTQPMHTVNDFRSTTALGYEYEYTEALKSAFAVPRAAQRDDRLLSTDGLSPLFHDTPGAELSQHGRLQYRFPSTQAAGRTALVQLKDLKIPTLGSYLLRAYVHPRQVPATPDDPAFVRRFFAGYTAMWEAHPDHAGHEAHDPHSGHHYPGDHPTSCTVRLAVTSLLSVDEPVLTLQYVPAPGPQGQSVTVPGLVGEVSLDDVLMEVYG
ncbi:MAG: tyrosinase family protein [Pseudonocardiaceae bacterium]